MKNYLNYSRRLLMRCSFLLSVHFSVNAQSKEKAETYLNVLTQAEASTDAGKTFSITELHPFLYNSEFFKHDDQKLVLPFQGAIWKTIPEFVETGGKSFDQLIDSTVDGKPMFSYLISSAAKQFEVDEEKVELHFLYYLKSENELIGGKNMILVYKDDTGIKVSLQSITEAEIDINPNSIMNSLEKFYQYSEWKTRVAALSEK